MKKFNAFTVVFSLFCICVSLYYTHKTRQANLETRKALKQIYALRTQTVEMNSSAFKDLPKVDGLVLFCHDCETSDPCKDKGAGAIAKRVGSIWYCGEISEQGTAPFAH